ncbi:MAG: hypothetical protein M3Q92_13085 [Actinomycetota bacterium]|nr:hypothetical protein [Actinomycetota bacterium]
MATVPPLAGLCSYAEATSAESSVESLVRLLRRFARIERRTLLVLAAHLNAVPEWEVKCALSLHLWQDAEHCAWQRERVAELRKPPHYLDRPDDAALEAFFEELIRSRSTLELLTGVYRVLKPSVLEAIEAHRARGNPLADQPTFRLLRFVALEEREQVDWGAHAIAALGGADEDWERHLSGYLRAAGGASGDGDRADRIAAPRAAEPLELVRVPRRDERFTRLWDSRGRLPGFDAPRDEVNWRMLYVRLTEMHAAELIALTLYEWPEASFGVHRDLARHLWDETRHSMFGEVAFETRGVDWHTVPHELSFASFPNTQLEPRERYALLYGAEHAAMGKRGKTSATRAGKPEQHAAARASGDPLSTLFHDHDWADEVLHVHIGRRLLADAYESTDARDEAATRAWERYQRIVEEDLALERSEWWDEFYAGISAARRAPKPRSPALDTHRRELL